MGDDERIQQLISSGWMPDYYGKNESKVRQWQGLPMTAGPGQLSRTQEGQYHLQKMLRPEQNMGSLLDSIYAERQPQQSPQQAAPAVDPCAGLEGLALIRCQNNEAAGMDGGSMGGGSIIPQGGLINY